LLTTSGLTFSVPSLKKKIEKEQQKKEKLSKILLLTQGIHLQYKLKAVKREFDITSKLKFLNNLELPFFIGVVNPQKLSVSIYSGDVIPELFSLVGLPPEEAKDKFKVKVIFRKDRKRYVTIKQHIFPVKNIERFINLNGRVVVYLKETSKEIKLKPDDNLIL
jgi:hypothetical protein